jgi:hypothetical protein
MEEISEEDFERSLAKVRSELVLMPEEAGRPATFDTPVLSLADLEEVQRAMSRPSEMRKELAVKVKLYVDFLIKKESQQGRLSEDTRKWVVTYDQILAGLHDNIVGKVSVNVQLGKITHSHLAAEVRRAKLESELVNVTPKEQSSGDSRGEG